MIFLSFMDNIPVLLRLRFTLQTADEDGCLLSLLLYLHTRITHLYVQDTEILKTASKVKLWDRPERLVTGCLGTGLLVTWKVVHGGLETPRFSLDLSYLITEIARWYRNSVHVMSGIMCCLQRALLHHNTNSRSEHLLTGQNKKTEKCGTFNQHNAQSTSSCIWSPEASYTKWHTTFFYGTNVYLIYKTISTVRMTYKISYNKSAI